MLNTASESTASQFFAGPRGSSIESPQEQAKNCGYFVTAQRKHHHPPSFRVMTPDRQVIDNRT
jgi:hypothetical protein